MSADNFAVITKDDNGKIVVLHRFMSDDSKVEIEDRDPRFDNLQDAIDEVQSIIPLEYGYSIDACCWED